MNASNANQNGSNQITISIHSWDTGREYSDAGQRIAAVVLPSTGQVAFVDVDRGISGVTRNALPGYSGIPALKTFLMEEYDRCSYSGDFYDVSEIGNLQEISGFAAKMKIAATEQLKNETVILNQAPKRAFDPVSPEGYALVLADPVLQLKFQDDLDAYFAHRFANVRHALREADWVGENRAPALDRDGMQIRFDSIHVGAGRNIVGGSWKITSTNNLKLPENLRKIAEFPDVLKDSAENLVNSIDLVMAHETNRIMKNRKLSPYELTFKEFSEIASVTKLINHGRQWEVRFGSEHVRFADGPSLEGALRQAHLAEVSNAICLFSENNRDSMSSIEAAFRQIHSNSQEGKDFMVKSSFPPDKVLSEYPELREKFTDVFEVRDSVRKDQVSASPANVVTEGKFSGKVVAVTDNGLVTQKINRNGDTILHALKSLSEPVVVGSVVDIKYQGRIGVVTDRALDMGKGR